MQPTLIRIFTYSSGALLLAAASAGFITNWASAGFTTPHDPIFMISIRLLFWIVGGVGLAVALVCLFGRKISLQLTLILWLSMNLVMYRAGLACFGMRGGFRGYFANLSGVFGISPNTADEMLKIMVLYLLIGSSISLLFPWAWTRMRKVSVQTNGHIKNFCPSCGGKVEFPVDGIGREIPCPHCQTTITLRKRENLKMSCFFCKEHIEFPAHALGQKIHCPHCNMDITLKEPV
jgi:DNA-directed RNA polymerase subunit RPC12/RpoP